MALEHLTIRNFAIIERLDIELGDGLTVVTGETGAGKSIIFSALNLLLGARAEAGMIRHNSDGCEITAEFSPGEESPASDWLSAHQLQNDSKCIIRRIIRKDKAGKCYINDRPVTLGSVRELGQCLVDIHGQHEHQSLLRAPVQRQILDNYAGIRAQVAELADGYRSIKTLSQRLASLEQNRKQQSDRLDLLKFQVNELNEAQIEEGEFRNLEAELQRLANAQELIEGMQETVSALYEAEQNSVSSVLGISLQKISALAEFDPRLKDAAELLASSLAQTDEAASVVRDLLSSIEHDPARLKWVEQRMDTLISLARKHRCGEDGLLQRLQELIDELENVEDESQQPEVIEAELAAITVKYRDLATEISSARRQAASELSAEITLQMQDLGMQGGQFEIDVQPLAEEGMAEHGMDQVDLLVSTNPGIPLKPLVRTASGGELSRISLAIEVVNSESSHVPTLMFDEVDVGVGGGVAEIVGQRLRELGAHAQVLTVTHLPQVAAQGHGHLLVKKTADTGKEVTYSEIVPLNKKQRIQELARMLGGMEITNRTLAHAHEMLKQAS